MRTAITEVKTSTGWKQLFGQEVSIEKQKKVFKELILDNGKSDLGLIEEIQMWTSSNGIEKRHIFKASASRISVKESIKETDDDLASALAGLSEEKPKRKSKK